MTTGAEIAFMSKEALVVAQIAQTISRIFREDQIYGGRFSEIINGIPLKIIEKMNDIIETVDALEAKLKKQDFDLGKSLNDLEKELGFWERNLMPNALKDYNNRIHTLKNDITKLIENYIMISRCYERGHVVGNALSEALAQRAVLDAQINADIPLEVALKNVRGYAQTVRNSVNLSGSA